MKLLLKVITILFVTIALFYLLVPVPDFPEPPLGAVQSFEPADTETPQRRAYFTDLNREAVIDSYVQQFSFLPYLRLNYPPEEAQTIIRDQTRSYYLEEIVQPLRSSFYVNGFVPQEEKDAVIVDGVEYYQKITVRYIPSSPIVRVSVFVASIFVLIFIVREWSDSVKILWPRKK